MRRPSDRHGRCRSALRKARRGKKQVRQGLKVPRPWRGGWTGRRGGEGPPAAPPDTGGRNGSEANGLGFSRERQPAPGFDPAKSTESRRIRSDGQDQLRAANDGAGQIRPRWEGSFPAQAHAEAWDAGALSAKMGRGPVLLLGLGFSAYTVKFVNCFTHFQKHFL